MPGEKQEKLPIDAGYLSDAVIELNISRRSVGLYPQEHPLIRKSLERALAFLQKLFDLRNSITLGVAKDFLLIDEYTLDRRNPVFREFALSLHSKGIAALTFYAGLTIEEIFKLHELIVSRDGPIGRGLLDLAEKRGLRHVRLAVVELTKFRFVEGRLREGGFGANVLEDYVYGLLENRLTDEDAEDLILTVPPEDIAIFVENYVSEDAPEETYDQVITKYMRKKDRTKFRGELFIRFLNLVENLSPALKKQFLKRASHYPLLDEGEAEALIANLSTDEIKRITVFFEQHPSMIAQDFFNTIDKLKEVKACSPFYELLFEKKAVVDDIEIDETVLGLLEGDRTLVLIPEGYRKQLERIRKNVEFKETSLYEKFAEEFKKGTEDKIVTEIMLEILERGSLSDEDALNYYVRFMESANEFLETGRFREIAKIYSTLYPLALSGRFGIEALNIIQQLSSEPFTLKLIEAIKLWGRYDREAALGLAITLRTVLINPLLNALAEEMETPTRSLILFILSGLGGDVVPEAANRLNDGRWFVVRNMLYLIRKCGGVDCVKRVRQFCRHENTRIGTEAVRTLLQFNTPDAFSYVKSYLEHKDPEIRDQGVRLVGSYRIEKAVPYLIELFEKRDLLGTGSYYKISIVRALAEIGDVRSVDAFMKLCRSKNLPFRSSSDQLIIEIFKSLNRFPGDVVRPLLEVGLASKNKEIRSASEKLLKKISAGYA